MPRVSVLMPTFERAAFIPRAIESVFAQTLEDWELVVVDDGSADATPAAVEPYLDDQRIRYDRLERNLGLGAALNRGLTLAEGELVAYLPDDDVYYVDHLVSLADRLEASPDAPLAYSGVRHHYNRAARERADGFALQLVQVMHRATAERWVERSELVTDDLERMLWGRLRKHGEFVATGQVTCEWVDHPAQRHKLIAQGHNGLNTYRSRYRVQRPIRFEATSGNAIDEVEHYRRFRERADTPPARDGLTILLVGELAYNPERVLALEERGHRLYGLWMPSPSWFNTVGPLPFGHVDDVARSDWRDAVRRLRPDVIYALLNWQAVPFAHHVLVENPGVPFVWHFKEGPFVCIEKGTWRELVDLYTRADGRIYTTPELRDWFRTVLPPAVHDPLELVLDGDLPKRDWLEAPRSPPLSDDDGEVHTVVPGRPIGLHPPLVAALAANGIHLHFYGEFMQGLWREWIGKSLALAPRHLHLHPAVHQDRWVAELSRYDAGWLHFFRSENEGEIRRSNWDDLNYPARLATLVAAGLPLLQRDNAGSVVATQSLARRLELGLFFSDADELSERIRDERRLAELRESVWRQRHLFTFDHHADDLVAFFRRAIERRTG